MVFSYPLLIYDLFHYGRATRGTGLVSFLPQKSANTPLSVDENGPEKKIKDHATIAIEH